MPKLAVMVLLQTCTLTQEQLATLASANVCLLTALQRPTFIADLQCLPDLQANLELCTAGVHYTISTATGSMLAQ